MCHACCCYNIPFDKGELEVFKDRIVNPVIGVQQMFDAVLAFTDFDFKKNKCPFLREDYKCNIYENRPEVCRAFGQDDRLPCKWIKK